MHSLPIVLYLVKDSTKVEIFKFLPLPISLSNNMFHGAKLRNCSITITLVIQKGIEYIRVIDSDRLSD